MTKTQKTKRALLASAMSLILCFTMLLGTTYAWFTDSVTSGNNKIIAGNLDVEVYYGDPAAKNSIQDVKTLFDDVKLWEPGAVAYENLTVVNEGSLELAYQFAINYTNENTVTVDGKAYGLSDVLKVAVVKNGVNMDGKLSREAVVASIPADSWKPMAAWADGAALAPKASATYGVVIYWAPSANDNIWNINNGKTTSDGEPLHIDLGVKVVATQKDAESDSFGNDYDKNASVTVGEDGAETLAKAVAAVEDGGIVFLEPGVYELSSGPITIEGKSLSIIGLGDVVINKNYGNTHIFTIKNGADVTFENVTMDGKGNTREGVYVRWNSKVTLKDCTIKNTGGLDVMIDEASDAGHGENTASYVWLINSHIEDVAMCASPVTTVAATQDTYVYFNYDAASTVGSIDVQSINKRPENIIINGVKSTEVGTTMYLNVTNDAELKDALNTIKTNSAYWNKNVIVNMAAGEYSGNYVFDQYPEWNSVVGAGATANNYAGGVPAGAPGTVVTFVGANTNTRSASAATKITGNFTVNGFGNAGTGFGSAVATTTFKSITFDAANSAEDNGKDRIALYVTAAASNVTFAGCTFVNATHVTLGASGPNGVGKINFAACTFNDGGCLSGYVETLNVSDTTVTAAAKGFISNQKAGTVTVADCDITCSEYAFRTQNSNINITVTDSKINVANEVGGVRALVVFRGSNHSAEFTDCELTYGTRTAGNGTGTLIIKNYYDDDGVTYYTDGVSGDVVLSKVSADAPANLVIPNDVDALSAEAFAGSSVKTVTIPNSVTNFGCYQYDATSAYGSAFKNSAVETVILADGMKEIPNAAFSGATNLKSVTIPASVESVGIWAFRSTALSELLVPVTVETIGYGAFRDMPNLTTVTIEGDVYVPNYAFRACASLKHVYLNGTNVTFGDNMIFTVTGTNNENPNGITVHVANDAIKARLEATGQFKGTIVSKLTAATNGVYGEGNNTYAYADDAEEISSAMKNGAKTVYVSAGTYKEIPSISEGVTLVGGDDVVFEDTLSGTLNNTTLKNIHIKAGNAQRWAYAKGDLVFEGCTFDASSVYAIHYDGLTDANVTYKDCKIVGWAAIGSGAKHITFDGCEIYGNGTYGVIRLYSPGTIKNCTFDVDNVNTSDVYQDGIHAVDCEIKVSNNVNVNGEMKDLYNISGTGKITEE